MPRYSYATNSGAIAYIRRSAAIAALDPSTPPTADPVDPSFFVSVSKSRRSQGLTARHVNLSRVDATGPSGIKAIQRVKVPCLTVAGATAMAAGGPFTYKGKSDWTFDSVTPEG